MLRRSGSKSSPSCGSNQTWCASSSPIISESQVLPVRPAPKIQTISWGFITVLIASRRLRSRICFLWWTICSRACSSSRSSRSLRNPGRPSTTLEKKRCTSASRSYLSESTNDGVTQEVAYSSAAFCPGHGTYRSVGVELFQEGSGYLLYHLRLLFGEVFFPASGRGLPVEFALPLLLFGDVLPGVLLHYPRELSLLHWALQLC